jgi:hypothetical protein
MADLRPHHDAVSDLFVSHLDGRGSLAPGYVIVTTCTARTDDGFLAAERQVMLHVAGSADRPRTGDEARSVARRLLRGFDMRAAVSAVDRWFADVQGVHEAAVRHRLARELELRGRDRERGALQPGLFDRRALAASDRAAASEELRDEVHRRHLAALERSRTLHLTCVASAVLIVWR